MEADDAKIRAAVGVTVDAGTVHFEMRMESEPAGMMRERSQGVCDFAHRREACHTVTELPADVPDVFQITDGGIVYSRDTGDEWHVLDMGSWASAGLLSVLGWLYGVVDVRTGDGGDHGVTMSAARALETCPAPLRDELRTSFHQAGHLDAVATGRVRTDASGRIVECRLELPASVNGLFGSVDVGSRITVVLSDFGEPAHIRPPDAGPAQPIEDFVEHILRHVEEGE
ncbi:hypothetical protein K1T35_40130 [Pseudonocardia sp. DSM 110487]|uniref:hypothetical protein n=1 Tax=Pseudonocardia sp. DSM 110487 TaxID=2865833 RepID=UPI001C6997ED|nr:hypothetical protein [Pseudonocardia sp. DSM 110487]QYN34541.1 hypothetical protein K1T35_40130 [Pseudonocardia sp. DSM 110487]